MKLQDQIKSLELEMMKIIEQAFYYGQHKQIGKLAICLEALNQLEEERESITKTKFIFVQTQERLNSMYEELKKEFPQAVDYVNKKLK